jgi:hypothetical protein
VHENVSSHECYKRSLLSDITPRSLHNKFVRMIIVIIMIMIIIQLKTVLLYLFPNSNPKANYEVITS